MHVHSGISHRGFSVHILILRLDTNNTFLPKMITTLCLCSNCERNLPIRDSNSSSKSSLFWGVCVFIWLLACTYSLGLAYNRSLIIGK